MQSFMVQGNLFNDSPALLQGMKNRNSELKTPTFHEIFLRSLLVILICIPLNNSILININIHYYDEQFACITFLKHKNRLLISKSKPLQQMFFFFTSKDYVIIFPSITCLAFMSKRNMLGC